MTQALPSMGRSGVQTVRRISGLDNPGWQAVDPNANIIAGQVATRTVDANGNVILTLCNQSTLPCAIFALHKTLNFYDTVVNEPHVSSATITLSYANVSYVGIVSSSGTQYSSFAGNFTVNATNGIITNVNMPLSINLLVSYLYQDPTQAGIDQTLPTGLITIFEGPGEIGTLIYDTTYAISVNSLLRCNSLGFLSANSVLTGKIIGITVSPPTASNPELVFKLSIEY